MIVKWLLGTRKYLGKKKFGNKTTDEPLEWGPSSVGVGRHKHGEFPTL